MSITSTAIPIIKRMLNPKLVLFDADGMMIPKNKRFSDYLAHDFGISTEITKPFFERVFQECLIGKGDLRAELPKYLKIWSWQKSLDEFLEHWFKSEHYIDKRIVNIIEELKAQNIFCCLATNQEKHRTFYIKENMGFGRIFNKIFSSSDIGYKKPQKEFFQYIMHQFPQIKRDEALFWDDDVEGAKDFGLQGEVYKNFEEFKKKLQTLNS